MTIARLLQSTLAALLFGAFGSQLAHADIYTWVDSSGTLNVSNIAPPDGTRVTSVIHASAPETAARDAAAHEAARQAEVQALNERMRQLEGEVQIASRQVPPPDYRPLPAPPVVQYFVNAAPPPEQQPPMHPPFGGQPPLHPPFAAQQPMPSAFGTRKG